MRTFEGIAAALAMFALTMRLRGRQHRLLHLFQLEHYEGARLMLWLRRRGELWPARELAAFALLFGGAIAAHASGSSGSGWLCGALLLATTPLATLGVGDWRRAAVKPLVFTGRAKRLYVAALLPPALLVPGALAVAHAGPSTAGLAVLLALALLALAAAPWTLLGANLALGPVQSAINRRYVQRARDSLRDYAPLVVGITGSYGKTTTKFCVGEMLATDRPTLVTPESYNSFLGVIRTINEHLQARHRAFVVEMGMFRRGDIAELCALTHPTVGVITAIGPMHLERLGSIEAIAAAKGELLAALPPDGHFITNGEDPRCVELARGAHVPVTLFGIHEPNPTAVVAAASHSDGMPPRTTPSPKKDPEVEVIARDIQLVDGRTTFQLQLDGPNSPQVEVSAGLLGRHNVLNLLAAAAVGRVLEDLPRTHRRGTRAGAGPRAPPAADPQPPRRGGGDRRRLQLQPRWRRRGARGAARAPRHAPPVGHAWDGRAGGARGTAQPRLRPARGGGLRPGDPRRPRAHRADPRRTGLGWHGPRERAHRARHRRGHRAVGPPHARG